MVIKYRSNKLKKECTIYSEAIKAYGEDIADKIHQRIGEISSAPSIQFLVANNIGRCHELKGRRRDEFGMDLVHPHRLVIKQDCNDDSKAVVLSIEDYH